jgi:hypothetical protein
MRIALLYTAISVLATAANLGSQALVVNAYRGQHAIELSIAIGTLVGMPIKYVLEKRLIFGFVSRNLAHDGWLLVLYSSMGLITTAVFWGIEYAFHRIFLTDHMRYLGGALGLALGSFIKYHLDKRFVFVQQRLTPQGLH